MSKAYSRNSTKWQWELTESLITLANSSTSRSRSRAITTIGTKGNILYLSLTSQTQSYDLNFSELPNIVVGLDESENFVS
jgi:hypothetical protein